MSEALVYQKKDLIIIGAGPAGLAAAMGAREAGIQNLLILEREDEPGGILRQCIHNGFGLHRFKEELTGPEYAQRDIDKAKALNINIQCGTTVLSIEALSHEALNALNDGRQKDDLTDIRELKQIVAISEEKGLEIFIAPAVILAMGCRERPRGALATPGTRCSGIFSAGTAQKYVNLEGYMPGKRVIILGSGDIGLIMARRMTLQGAKVLACVEIMPYSSGLNRNIVQCLDDYQIPLLLSHTVINIEGHERLSGVTIAQVDENRMPIAGTEQRFDCDTLLLSVGLIPENELSEGAGVSISPLTGGPIVDDGLQTNIPGIFACGNVLHVHDLVDYVSAESLEAGRNAAEYIRHQSKKDNKIYIQEGKGVRGIVPQLICPMRQKDLNIMFRPDKVYENAKIIIKNGDREIYNKKSRILTPGEMINIIIPQKAFEGFNAEQAMHVTIEA